MKRESARSGPRAGGAVDCAGIPRAGKMTARSASAGSSSASRTRAQASDRTSTAGSLQQKRAMSGAFMQSGSRSPAAAPRPAVLAAGRGASTSPSRARAERETSDNARATAIACKSCCAPQVRIESMLSSTTGANVDVDQVAGAGRALAANMPMTARLRPSLPAGKRPGNSPLPEVLRDCVTGAVLPLSRPDARRGARGISRDVALHRSLFELRGRARRPRAIR